LVVEEGSMSETISGALVNIERVILTDEEQALLDDIEFNSSPYSPHSYEAAQKSSEAACKLMHLLLTRHAIPAIRLLYFTDAKFQTGRVRCSRKEVFERNGCNGDEIFRHAHFTPYLRYFLNGPDLPAAVIAAFLQRVAACYRVTSGDFPGLWAFVRELVRSHRLDRREAAEEFFKLALECGFETGSACSFRDAAMKVR
jgi:hypothetical protein